MKIDFVEGASFKPFEKTIETEMEKHTSYLEKELQKIRTGRAHPSMIEEVKVHCYDTIMPLKEVAAVSAPDVALLVVQPWDKNIMPEIEKALQNAELGVTPLNDGTVIRIQLQNMSASRRDELIKVISQKVETARVAIRNVRKEVQNSIREAEKAKKVSEDYGKRLQDILQKITDKFIELSDKLGTKKESEVKPN